MNSEELTVACIDAGLAARAEQIVEASRPCVELIPKRVPLAQLSLGASRLGGVPDLPDGFRWPSWRDGPLSFIAQIDLADLVAHPASTGLPRSGHLLFFYDAQQQTWGFDPADRESWHVSFVPEGNLHRSEPPENLPEDARFPACAVSLRDALTLPPAESAAFESLGFSENEREAYFNLLDGLFEDEQGASSWLLGHPDPIQGDMQTECALVTGGLYTGDESGWNDPRRPELEKDAPSWRLLLQVGSEDEANMMWGDAGHLYFWLHERDLAARAFDRAWMILQCH